MTTRQLESMACTRRRWLREHQASARARLDAARSLFADLPDGDACALAAARINLADAVAWAREWGLVDA